MTRIESKHVDIARTPEEIYNYLMDLKNVENILPAEKISNFQAGPDSFAFKITGAIPVELKIVETIPNKLIKLKTTPNNSFQFTLDIILNEKNGGCEAYQLCEADINAFMKIMIEKPLSNLFDYMVERLMKVMN